MLAPKTRPGEVPHRVLGVIFEVFEVLSGLGRRALHGQVDGFSRWFSLSHSKFLFYVFKYVFGENYGGAGPPILGGSKAVALGPEPAPKQPKHIETHLWGSFF